MHEQGIILYGKKVRPRLIRVRTAVGHTTLYTYNTEAACNKLDINMLCVRGERSAATRTREDEATSGVCGSRR